MIIIIDRVCAPKCVQLFVLLNRVKLGACILSSQNILRNGPTTDLAFGDFQTLVFVIYRKNIFHSR